MLLISHRGNISSINLKLENTVDYIQKAIDLGYDVEIDVRLIEKESEYNLFLGHDSPDHLVSLKWLLDRKNNLWIHTKNFKALQFLIDYNLRIFYHQKENHTIINNCNIIWSHELSEANEKSIIPLLGEKEVLTISKYNVFGICSDFIGEIR